MPRKAILELARPKCWRTVVRRTIRQHGVHVRCYGAMRYLAGDERWVCSSCGQTTDADEVVSRSLQVAA